MNKISYNFISLLEGSILSQAVCWKPTAAMSAPLVTSSDCATHCENTHRGSAYIFGEKDVSLCMYIYM